MDNYHTTEVYNYLSCLEYYLQGDLATFHRVCEEVEKYERNSSVGITSSDAGSMYKEPSQGDSFLPIIQPIRYPGDGSGYYFINRKIYTEIFRLTIPITLALFATIDILGYLSGLNNDPVKTGENFKEFSRKSSSVISESDAKFLNEVYRQGLTHVYFPKLGLCISYHSTNPNGRLIFKNNQGILTLNVNTLEEIVLETLKTIKAEKNLYTQMEARYHQLINKYEKQVGQKIKNYSA